MGANVPFATELATTNANLTALAQQVVANTATAAANAAAIAALAKQQGVDEATLAGLIAATPPVVIPPPVIVDPQIQWRAGMETGDLSAWSDQTNTGSASSSAVQVINEGIAPRVSKLFGLPSLWAMKQAVTGAVGGTRMARYPEVAALTRAGTPFYVSWWDYYPSTLSYGPADMFSLWQIASVDANAVPSPIWTLNLHGSGMTPDLIWSPNNMAGAGPHSGENAGRAFFYGSVPVLVSKWNFFEVGITPAADYTGALKVWLNGAVVFDLSGIRTRFPDSPASATLPMYVTHNAYGSGLMPTPAVHYVDDVTVSLGRMP